MIRNVSKTVTLSILLIVIGLGFGEENTVYAEVASDVEAYNLESEAYYQVPAENEVEYVYPLHLFSPLVGNSFLGFKEALAFSESSGNYFAINRFGYKGRYQLGRSALTWLGIRNHSRFLNSPLLQEKAFETLLSRNKYVLRDYLGFVGQKIGGVLITESGLLAAAHLGGAGNVMRYLDSGGLDVFRDGNGISLRVYMKRFSNYDLSCIKADANATV